MYFINDSLLPEDQGRLIIIAAQCGPHGCLADYPEDIVVSRDAQVDNFKGYGDIAGGGIFDLEDGVAHTAPRRR
jgi:hypothetical protein